MMPPPGGALGVFGALTGKLGDAAALVSMAEGEREHRRVEQRQGHLGYVCTNEVRASQLAQASERVGSPIPASQQG